MSKYKICYSRCLNKSRVARAYILDYFKKTQPLKPTV